jgi:hypothetical protein
MLNSVRLEVSGRGEGQLAPGALDDTKVTGFVVLHVLCNFITLVEAFATQLAILLPN